LDEAIQHSGIKQSVETKQEEPCEEMLSTLQSLHNRLDRIPKSTELPKEYSPNEFYDEFGSWDEALKAAGIDEKQATLDEIERVKKLVMFLAPAIFMDTANTLRQIMTRTLIPGTKR
jgi:hypothetical protein